MAYFKYVASRDQYERGQCSSKDMRDFFSYGWWQVTKVFEGRLFYNSYFYSATTAKHQSWIRQEVSGYFSIEAPDGLQDLTSKDIVLMLLEEKAELELKIPKGRGQTNDYRKQRLSDIGVMLDYLADRVEV